MKKTPKAKVALYIVTGYEPETWKAGRKIEMKYHKHMSSILACKLADPGISSLRLTLPPPDRTYDRQTFSPPGKRNLKCVYRIKFERYQGT